MVLYYICLYLGLSILEIAPLKKALISALVPLGALGIMRLVPKNIKADPGELELSHLDWPFALLWSMPGIFIARPISALHDRLRAILAPDPCSHDIRILAAFPETPIKPLDMALQSDGKLLLLADLGGYREATKLTRFLPSGALDDGFALNKGCLNFQSADRLLVGGHDKIGLYNEKKAKVGESRHPLLIFEADGTNPRGLALPQAMRISQLVFNVDERLFGLQEFPAATDYESASNFIIQEVILGEELHFKPHVDLGWINDQDGFFEVNAFAFAEKGLLLMHMTKLRAGEGPLGEYLGRADTKTRPIQIQMTALGWNSLGPVCLRSDGSVFVIEEALGRVSLINPDGRVDKEFEENFRSLGEFDSAIIVLRRPIGELS